MMKTKKMALGGPAPMPTAAAAPAAAAARKPVVPVKPTPAPVLNPSQMRQQEAQAHINQVNARDGGNRLVDRAAMDAAVNKSAAIKAATDARLKAEAVANRVPPSQDKYAPIKRMMDAVQSRSTVPVKRAAGGKVKSASSRADGCCVRGKTRA
jgi:hypothetical protein